MANTRYKDIFDSIVIAMAVVIMVVISALIVGTLTSNSIFDDIPVTGTNTNETLTNVTNITNSAFAINAQPGGTCTLSTVYNATGGEVLTALNYTNTNCYLILNSSSAYIGEDLNVTYTYSYDSGTSLAGFNATEATEAFGDFATNLIAFLAVIGTILGVVWLVLYVRRLFDKKEGLQAVTA